MLRILAMFFLMISFVFAQKIAYTGFEEPPAVGGQYKDFGDAATDHALASVDTMPVVNYTSVGGEMGFSSYYYNTLNDVGLTDGDYVGVTAYTGTVGSFMDGSQGFQFSDTDGLMETTFDRVDLSAYPSAKFSMYYFVQSTGWESADYIRIYLVLDDTTEVDLLNTNGSDIDDLGIEGSWTLLEYDLSGHSSAVLKVALQSNSGSEGLYIDDIQFYVPSSAKPEPTNHVTNFQVDSVKVNQVFLSWTGATGAQLPDKYLILAREQSAQFPTVKDSVFIESDSDWSDGLVAVNVPHVDGLNQYTFDNLKPGTFYEFKIYPYTNQGTEVNYKTDGTVPTVSATTLTPPITSIADIQRTPDDLEGDSPMKDQTVVIQGVVTAVSSIGFWVQDASAVWSGIFVYSKSFASKMQISYEVQVSGTVIEYNNKTEIGNVSDVTIISQNAQLPTPLMVSTSDVNQEKYEGVLVKVDNATCTNPDLGYGEWEIDDGSGPCRVDDLIFQFTPEQGKMYTVTGVVDYSYSNYKIEPRTADDIALISNAPVISFVGSSVLVPEASEDFVDTVMVTDNGTVTMVELKYQVNNGDTMSVAMSGTDSIFVGTIPASAYNDGDKVVYWIYAKDNDGEESVSDVRGFFAGTTAIGVLNQIDNQGQLTVAGFYARTTGVATVSNGVFDHVHLNVYMQDENFSGINIFKYNAADVTFMQGHKYQVTGMLKQYNGLLELVPEDVQTDIVDLGEATMPEPLQISISDLLTAPETLEGLLLKIVNVDTVAGTNAWPDSGYNANLTISDDGGTSQLTLRIDKDTDLDEADAPAWPQDVVGIFSQYDRNAPYLDGYQLLPRSTSDLSGITGLEDLGTNFLPERVALYPAFPNPFNPSTTLQFDLPEKWSKKGSVTLEIFNVLGQKVKTLIAGKTLKAGAHKVSWNARDERGQNVPTGVYFAVLRIGNHQWSQKLILLK